MLSRFQRRVITATSILIVAISCGEVAVKRLKAPSPAAAIETGVHWAAPDDFPMLKRMGYQFAVVSLDRDPEHWAAVFDAAEKAGIRLVAGVHPYPYTWGTHGWEIDSAGRQFLAYAQKRDALVKAVFVFNEPYWLDPSTGANSPCGAFSAEQLRNLRSEIRKIWPRALVYHDFGRPSLWAPGGAMQREHACVGTRYADASGVADYAGIWFYPVNNGEGYRREEFVRTMRDEVAYVARDMRAEPIILGQAFRCARCTHGTRMPTLDEIRDINCTMRWIGPQGISWYPWRQPVYEESLASHEDLWEAIGPRGCPDGREI